MSTTRSTSEVPYTIVGGTRVQNTGPGVRGMSAVVLNRGGRTVRSDSLERLLASGVDEIVSVLGPAPHYDVEQLAAKLSNTRFILLGSEVTAGERVNIGIHESVSPFVFVLWSDHDLARVPDRAIAHLRGSDALCAVPTMRNERGVIMPSITAPAFHGAHFRTIPVQPGKSTDRTLYAFDYVGIYNRDRFESLGGYDGAIANPYWQRLDLGLRSYLWGEHIAAMPECRVDATRPLPVDDTTPDASYSRFHLKNLAVRFTGDSGRLPLKALFSLLLRSGLGPRAAISLFSDVRNWTRSHKYRFVQDARRVTELWEVEQ